MSNGELIKGILQQIKDNRMDAREGLKRLNELKQQQVPPVEVRVKPTEDTVKLLIMDVLCRIIKIQPDELQEDLSFKEMGIDSISSVEIVRDLNDALHIHMDGIQLYDYPNISELSSYVWNEVQMNSHITVEEDKQQSLAAKEPPAKQRLNHRYEYMNDLISQFSKNNPKPTAQELPVSPPQKAESPAPEPAVSASRPTAEKLALSPVEKSAVSEAGQPLESLKPALTRPSALSLKPLHSPDRRGDEKQNTVQPPRLKLKGNHAEEAASGRAQATAAEAGDDARTVESVAQTMIPATERASSLPEGIAIIGISGRFPGASTTRELWRNLRDGVCSIGEVPEERFDIHSAYDEDRKAVQKTYCKVAGLLDNVDEFDPLFFNISPREAEMMDPQQRIFLEEAWNALEDAGYSDRAVQDTRCGVFVGCAPSDYTKHLEANSLENTAEAFTGTSSSILAARISYFLNLKGPSISIDTACSSSLVAVHQACSSLWSGECDMALAGGIRLMFTPDSIVQSSQMEILSKEGVCRPFDNGADGTLLSEGTGVVVLKPLGSAIRDRDYIYGVIRGSGVNQDGRTNGITAPSVNSQIQLEKTVYEKFDIDPADINYVESHGTGTSLGDPIEVKALTEAFRHFTADSHYCALGSIKANIGHTTMAAGVAGIIKILLSLKSRKIPPLIHYRELNEKIKLQGSPFYINTELVEWPVNKKGSRMAAVSSFGFSGTNCHIVIEEYRSV
ncbi:beta-ketoacyl synthase N-terminal-like domain-containing protein [Paenibacillus lutimineralis]|uniref:Uncharacterized protein n=1 Tax=Paenibacillus lutimineralis TaxID=2707005 RepID=A0A3Q9I9F8_9BACL|nr:beta-ketoacyl synthase N-terminal-like domain-containing protein [Paenibacillus lutimineralis]AZS14157.1 hypothetical protein EI981_06605 [Paenibacillus lutimineralis]